jgi:hypothetical protein
VVFQRYAFFEFHIVLEEGASPSYPDDDAFFCTNLREYHLGGMFSEALKNLCYKCEKGRKSIIWVACFREALKNLCYKCEKAMLVL